MPVDLGGISQAAYCSFTRPSEIRTPYFEIVIEPLEDEGLVSVSDQGRTLFITSPPWPGAAFLEVRASNRRERDFFERTETTRGILELEDGETQCELITISNREWAVCRSNDAPNIRTRYRIAGDMLYEVSFNDDVRGDVRLRSDRIFSTLDPVQGEN
jgi:hypothetical protein